MKQNPSLPLALAFGISIGGFMGCTSPPASQAYAPAEPNRDCKGFKALVLAMPDSPEAVGTATVKDFTEEAGRTWCVNASVFGIDTAWDGLADSFDLFPPVGNHRSLRASNEVKSKMDRIVLMAEQRICPDWRKVKFALGDWDKAGKPLVCNQ